MRIWKKQYSGRNVNYSLDGKISVKIFIYIFDQAVPLNGICLIELKVFNALRKF